MSWAVAGKDPRSHQHTLLPKSKLGPGGTCSHHPPEGPQACRGSHVSEDACEGGPRALGEKGAMQEETAQTLNPGGLFVGVQGPQLQALLSASSVSSGQACPPHAGRGSARLSDLSGHWREWAQPPTRPGQEAELMSGRGKAAGPSATLSCAPVPSWRQRGRTWDLCLQLAQQDLLWLSGLAHPFPGRQSPWVHSGHLAAAATLRGSPDPLLRAQLSLVKCGS